jgi:DNA integrity scanning protein DisA with diadenylate cyclase activity
MSSLDIASAPATDIRGPKYTQKYLNARAMDVSSMNGIGNPRVSQIKKGFSTAG